MSDTIKKKSLWILLPALLIVAGFIPHLFELGKASSPQDSDSDGLEDSWELTHFGDLTSQDGNGDPDSDGYINIEEYDFGLDPNIAGGLPGYLSHQAWQNLGGADVASLVNSEHFYMDPDVNELVLGATHSLSGNNYGSRLRGTITAPVTGSYTFWISGDNSSELWLSTDESPFNRQRIAFHGEFTDFQDWDKFSSQQSAPVSLVAGQKYYLEVLHKEATGGDHVSVAWSYEANDYVNLTQQPGVVASQRHTQSGHIASKAIDGNTDGRMAAGSVTHTQWWGLNNWWQVNLGSDRVIEQIVLYNRTDCCKPRLSNFRVSILDSTGIEVYGRDYHTDGTNVQESLVLDIESPVLGRTVRVQFIERNRTGNGILSLAEVKVMGSLSNVGASSPLEYLTNWTQVNGVIATQSGTVGGHAASRAIDGNSDGILSNNSVTHTNAFAGQWWQVDLGQERPVNRVAIYNRTDCCQPRLSDFRIKLLDDSGLEVASEDFYTTGGHVGDRMYWDLPMGTSARKAIIEKLGPGPDGTHILSLAEVKVLGNESLIPGSIQPRELIPAGVLESFVLDPNDLDDDLLPDDWELQYGFDLANGSNNDEGPFGDPDRDLLSNRDEYDMGTDPTVANIIEGAILHELWTDIPGRDVKYLFESPDYLLGPEIRGLVYTSEGPRGWGDFYANRLRGYITAPITGDYVFWLAGDNETQMWLSTDEDKFNAEKIIHPTSQVYPRGWDVDLSQKSRPIHLIAGQKYYVEILHKEEAGGDHFSVAWTSPGGNRELIPADYLSTYVPQANDQDDDNLPDDWELANGIDPTDNGSTDPINGAEGDLDGDGLKNKEELAAGTRADLVDTDGDGVNDDVEVELSETNALAADVAPFQSLQIINGASFSNSDGNWRSSGTDVYNYKPRGWVEYEINVPADGLYLLNLSLGAHLNGALSDEYEVLLSINGQFIERLAAEIADGTTEELKALTPWLTAGANTVRIFNDNALTYRQLKVETVELLSAQGGDDDSNGTPDWVDARIARLNGIESSISQSHVSPVAFEGRSRFLGMTHITIGGATIQSTELAGERWLAELPLDSQAPLTLNASFENGALTTTRSIEWVPTNLLTETIMHIRAGDSLRLTAFNGTVANGSDKVWLTMEGVTHYFKGKDPMVHLFDTAGTYVLDVLHRSGNGNQQSEVNHSVTVIVSEPVSVQSPVCVPGSIRTWDVPVLPEGAILEIDDRVIIRDTALLGDGSTRYTLTTASPEMLMAQVRLGIDGPVLQTIPIRGMTLRDADRTSIRYVQDFGDGSYQVDMELVVSSVYDDVTVRYSIFESGVTFDTGGILKNYSSVDFDELGQSKASFIKTNTSGSACHQTTIWQGNTRIAYLH